MIVEGKVGYLRNDMVHKNHKGIFDWIEKHNKYSSLEANELYELLYVKKMTGFRPSFFGGPVERKRAFRERIWPKLPLFLVPFLRFSDMYFWKLGFLDGMPGLIFSFLQSAQEFHTAVKLKELRQENSEFSKGNVKKYWDFQPCGAKYCSYLEGTKEFFEFTEKRRKTLEPFIKDFAKFGDWQNKKVLEIGCGIGIDTLEFSRAGAKITAIDISPKSVELTKKRLDYYSLTGDVKIGDAENLDFPDNTFDFVFSWGVLHHTPDTQKAISEVFRVLKPGGKFCIMLYHRKSLVGLQLYIRYGLLNLRPFKSLNEIFANYLESPGTKALTKSEIKNLFSIFPQFKIDTILTSYDVRIGKNLFLPNFFKKIIPKSFGFFLVITGQKP
jgi:ubiquinone/menaquinone biosynthesis C-methylase UbiE